MLKELHQAFGHIKFYDSNHTYVDSRTGANLTSVTTWLKQFQTPFNSDFWAKKKAKERGITQEELLKEWQDLKTFGVNRGKALHLIIEHKSNCKYFDYEIPKEVIDIGWEDKFIQELKILDNQVEQFLNTEKFIPIKNELILGNTVIAGQCDLLAYQNDKVVLYDWKTDKEISLSNKYQKLKAPYNDLDDTNYAKYLLQLSTYKRLIETQTNIKVDEMYIVHFNVNNDNYKIYPIKEYQWQK